MFNGQMLFDRQMHVKMVRATFNQGLKDLLPTIPNSNYALKLILLYMQQIFMLGIIGVTR